MKNWWGTVPNGQEECGDNCRTSPVGGLTSKSKKADKGYWCPVCMGRDHKYTWICSDPVKCPICGTRQTDMDKNAIKAIMRKK